MNWIIIGSGNGLSPGRHHAITWTNVSLLSIGLLGTNFSEIWIVIIPFTFKKIHLKMSTILSRGGGSSGRVILKDAVTDYSIHQLLLQIRFPQRKCSWVPSCPFIGIHKHKRITLYCGKWLSVYIMIVGHRQPGKHHPYKIGPVGTVSWTLLEDLSVGICLSYKLLSVPTITILGTSHIWMNEIQASPNVGIIVKQDKNYPVISWKRKYYFSNNTD